MALSPLWTARDAGGVSNRGAARLVVPQSAQADGVMSWASWPNAASSSR